MATDKTVNELIINKLTQAQYDAIPEAERSDTELYFITDADENALPDQTDNAGKFLMTDGTTVSWGNAISIKEQGVGNEGVIAIGTGDMKYGNYNTNSVIIGKGDHGQGYGAVVAIGSNAKVTASSSATIAIGYDAQAGYGESVVIGSHSKQAPNYGNGGQVTIGSWCTSSGSRAIVLGYECAVGGNYAIQLGGKKATNSDANTFKVGNENGNFEMMDANGKVPLDRLTYVTDQIGDISTILDSINGETLEG